MSRSVRLALTGALAALAVGLAAPAAGADPVQGWSPSRPAVFALTNNLTANQVVAFARQPDGSLVAAGRTDTGGRGGRLDGAVVDPLASQGALTYDAGRHVLLAVNAGSDTVSTLAVDGTRLALTQVTWSGGTFPVSVAVDGDLVAVLDAGGAGAVALFHLDGFGLQLVATRSLGLTAVTGPTQFVNTPGQVGFTPDGDQLVVTTKANGSDIDLLAVEPFGRLGAPVVNPSATPVPFGFVFDPAGRLVVAEAGTSDVSTYLVRPDGTLTPVASTPDGQAALCWIAAAGGDDFVANAGSATVTGYRIGWAGAPAVVSQVATDPGPIDLAATPDGSFLYVEAGGAGTIDAFRVQSDGALSPAGSVPVAQGLEGLAVS